MRVLAERYDQPMWAAGSISMLDAMFLFDVVRGLRPRKVIEVGVAGGASSAVLLMGLADARVPLVDASGEEALQSFELHPFCYFDRSKAVGCVARELVPELARGWKLHVRGTAREAGLMFAGRGVELAFIDADHRHPAPTADLLWLLPAMAPGAWVVLHDVDLPNVAAAHERRTGEKVDWHQRGAKELFEGWPWEKIRGGRGIGLVGGETPIGAANIGAIRIPEGGVKVEDLKGVIGKQWEMEVQGEMKRVLGV